MHKHHWKTFSLFPVRDGCPMTDTCLANGWSTFCASEDSRAVGTTSQAKVNNARIFISCLLADCQVARVLIGRLVRIGKVGYPVARRFQWPAGNHRCMYAHDIPTQKESQQIAGVYKKRSRHGCSVVRTATNGKEAGVIANLKPLKIIVEKCEGKFRPTGFRPVL